MKKILQSLACLSIILASCNISSKPASVSPQDHPFRAAILLPRALGEDSWTDSGYEGLMLIKEELSADVAFSEDIPESDYEKTFRMYAQLGYDFILGHGNQFIPAAEKVAAEFLNTDFAIVGKYGGNNINLGALSIREGEMAYLFGALGALKSTTQHIGYIGGIKNASQQEIIAQYKQGAEATNPAVTVTIDFVGNFTDQTKAERIAQTQIQAGVDVIFILAGAAGMELHTHAEKAGIHTLAWIDDLYHLAPEAVLTSNIQNIPGMLLRGAATAKQGRWEGKQYRFGLAENIQNLAPFHGKLTPDEENYIAKLKHDMLTGKIVTTLINQ